MAKRNPKGKIYTIPTIKPLTPGVPAPPEVLDPASVLVVNLVNIDLMVLADVTNGFPVAIHISNNPITVHTVEGPRLGDVSATDREAVAARNSSNGIVLFTEAATCVIGIP